MLRSMIWRWSGSVELQVTDTALIWNVLNPSYQTHIWTLQYFILSYQGMHSLHTDWKIHLLHLGVFVVLICVHMSPSTGTSQGAVTGQSSGQLPACQPKESLPQSQRREVTQPRKWETAVLWALAALGWGVEHPAEPKGPLQAALLHLSCAPSHSCWPSCPGDNPWQMFSSPHL